MGQNVLRPSLAGRSRVGHKPDPDRPVDTPTLLFEFDLEVDVEKVLQGEP